MPKVKLSAKASIKTLQGRVLNIVLQYIVTLQLIIAIVLLLKTIIFH